MTDNVSPRYVAKGRDVYDTAWANPFLDFVTAGVERSRVIVRYPSEQAALEGAESLNSSRVSGLANNRPFLAAAAEALAEAREDKAVRSVLLAEWVEGIDGLDTL
jgi:hypothetical protein